MARTLTRKGAIGKLDDLCRDIVWHRDKSCCRKCRIALDRTQRQGNVHHIVPKKRGYHVRWVIDNLILLCAGCHFWWHADPTAILWLKDDDPLVIDSIEEINQGETETFKQADLLELIESLTKFRDIMIR